MLELFQLQNDEGPCLDCVRTGEVVSVPDLRTVTDRWPLFTRAVADTPFRSVHALPMRLRRDTIGSLNLFHAEQETPLSANDQRIAQALADVATISILQQRSLRQSSELAEQLRYALDSRIVIEQAKGVLAEFGGLAIDRSFEALRGYARSNNLKVSDVATALVRGTTQPSDVVSPRAP